VNVFSLGSRFEIGLRVLVTMGSHDKLVHGLPELKGVQNTLLIPLWGRAAEYRQANPVMEDPWAVELLKRVKVPVEDFDKAYGFHQIGFPIRAKVLDSLVQGFLAKHPDGTVINLAAGLETAFQRNDNGQVSWYEVDLPEVIALRRQLLPPSERQHLITSSAFDGSWMEQVGNPEHVLVIAAGFLMYFPEEEVLGLMNRMANHFGEVDFTFDVLGLIPFRYRRIGVQWGVFGSTFLNRLKTRYQLRKELFYIDYYPERWGKVLTTLHKLPFMRKLAPRIYHVHLKRP